MQGKIKSYRPDKNYGFIETEDGTEYFFIKDELTGIKEDGYYLMGWDVTFDAVEEPDRPHNSAKNICFPEKPHRRPDPNKIHVPDEERTGFGKWSKDKLGRYRCSDCHCVIPTMEKFCPLCGAKMVDRKGRRMSYRASNKPNIDRSVNPDASPDGEWIFIEDGKFQCNKCHHISLKPWKFCGDCGTWMAKFINDNENN